MIPKLTIYQDAYGRPTKATLRVGDREIGLPATAVNVKWSYGKQAVATVEFAAAVEVVRAEKA